TIDRSPSVRVHAGDQGRHVLGRMAEVSVHIEDVLVLVFYAIFHSRDDRRAEAELPRAVQTVYTLVLGRRTITPLAGSVRRVVVNDEDVGLRSVPKYLFHQGGKVLDLVIGGHGYQS